ncbi:MAG: universal stress protein, partial [Ardenticatenaceae bacterium]
MFDNVLVAVDGSEGSSLASQYAVHLAQRMGSKVTLIHVVEQPPLPFYTAGVSEQERERFVEAVRESGRVILRMDQRPFAEADVSVDLQLVEGRPADVICKFADDEQFDVIIVGNRGRGAVRRALL